jgi:hypothetical protein
MRKRHLTKVLIRTANGWYFSRDKASSVFTKVRANAKVFDYRAEHIAERLDRIPKVHGIALTLEPVVKRRHACKSSD